MPGEMPKKKKNRRVSVEVTAAQIPSKKVPEIPAAIICKAPPMEKRDALSWYEPSVKGIDRGRPPPAAAASNRVSIIKLYGVHGVKAIGDLLQENIEKGGFYFTVYSGRMALTIKKLEDFVWAVNLLDRLGGQYHYKNTIQDKCERYVLRGIPAEYEAEIAIGLAERGFHVLDVHRLIGPKSSPSSPVFVLSHTPSQEGPKLTEVKRIRKWMVKVEPYKGTKKEPMLCYRCCRYDHTATFCTVNPRCYRCSGAHEGGTCNERSNFLCCNCDGCHPAFSKCCLMYQRVKEYNTKAKPRPPRMSIIGTGTSSGGLMGVPPVYKYKPKEKVTQKPPSRLPKRIAKSFVMVAWNAQGTEVENCPEFLALLEAQGAQMVCITGSHLLSESKWDELGWAVLGEGGQRGGKRSAVGPKLLIQKTVAHTRLTAPPLKQMSAVVAKVETKSGSVKVAVVYVGPNDSLVPEDVGALFKGAEPTIVFGDLCARHHAWKSSANNRRGKILKRAGEISEFSTFGPAYPGQYYKEEEVPFVVMAKGTPTALTVLPKKIKSGNQVLPEHLCPLVVHLKRWRRPEVKCKELPASLKELIRQKNCLRRQWQRTRFSLFKQELNLTKATIKVKLDEFRREMKKKG